MKLIDTHCHLDVTEFDADRQMVINHARDAGVAKFVIPGIDVNSWQPIAALCHEADYLYPAFGLHPVYLEQHTEHDLEILDQVLNKEFAVAVGEIGLDFYVTELDRSKQTHLFESQLELAQQHQLPVLIHARKSHDATLACLKKLPVPGGICHAFNGSLQQAHQYLDLGFKLGFGGMLTYQRSTKLRQLAKQLPLDSIVLETDAPDMTVASHHGQRNSPEYLPECLQALATCRQEDIEEIARQTTHNAEAVLPGLLKK